MSEITDTDDGRTVQSQFRVMQKFLREKLTDDRWSVIFEHSEPDDDTWIFAIGYRDRSVDGHFDRTEIQIHTTTHWSIPMVLVIDRGYRSRSTEGQLEFRRRVQGRERMAGGQCDARDLELG